MSELNSKNIGVFAGFLNRLARDMTRFYYAKLNKPFKVNNKLKGKGYDPVTTADRAFEKFIRSKIKRNFQLMKLLVKNLVTKKLKAILLG